VHANSTDDALARLETLASMSDVDIPFHALRDQVNSAVHIVIQLLRAPDGARRMVEVGYLTSRRREDFSMVRLMHFDPEAPGPADTRGAFVRHPVPASLAELLRVRGERVPSSFTVLPDAVAEGGGGTPWSR
jgi:pilus assembly protein CpaF